MSVMKDGVVRGVGFAIGVAMGAVLVLVLFGVMSFMFGAGIGAGMATASGAVATSPGGYAYVSGQRASRNKLLAVRVDGVILGSAPRDLSAQLFRGDVSYGYTIRRVLEDAANDQSIKGVLLHLQTPGGTIYGARAIHDGVLAFKRTAKKPVIAFIEGLSASGGVMAMVGADKIYADHGSFIGSIGVLGPQILYYNKPVATDGGLLGGGITTRDGIEQTIVTAGRGKDLGNPFRAPTAEEIQVLQAGVETEYSHFVKHVSTFRKIDEGVIRNDMGAHIFDNEKAQAFGLIDGTLDRNATIEKLADSAKVGKDYQLVRPRGEQAGFWAQFINQQGAGEESRAPQAGGPRVLHQELCDAAATRPLAYYGELSRLCLQ